MKHLLLCAVLVMAVGLAGVARAEEKVLFGFEKDTQGWEIPEWAREQQEYVATTVAVSNDFSREGKGSLRIEANFPGKAWTAALVEDFEYFDWSAYKAVSIDIYLPKEAPVGLKGKIILTVGDGWKFSEMARSVPLEPGAWTTVTASVAPGSEDWKKTVVDDNFRKDIRKIAVRVESNKKPEYKGPIYIDNIRLIK